MLTAEETRGLVDRMRQEVLDRTIKRTFQGEHGLLNFVKYFWHILEPQTDFVDGWPLQAICRHLHAVSEGKITRLLINVPPGFMKSLLVDVFWPAWEWAMLGPHLRYVTFSYSSDLTRRDNRRFGALVASLEYQALFGEQIKLVKTGEELVSNTGTGWKLASSIGGVGTGERGNRVILDDPHNVKESESPTVRQETVRWFREAMSNRLQDMETDAIIIIMQRVHGEDVSGVILEKGMDYQHLMIPMFYDYTRQMDDDLEPRKTSIGWYDPRYEECDPNDPSEEILAWPARFSRDVCHRMQVDVDMWAWACNPYEAPVLMADLSMKPIGEVRKGDTIVGFVVGNSERRAYIKETEVLAVNVSHRPVVKITFQSGETIRCTPDHKWWTCRNDKYHKAYAAAGLKSTLARVCPSRLPILAEADDLRLAGWLSGFFDGEGTVSLNKDQRPNRGSGAVIGFTQGDGRNAPLCNKLEYALSHFGFHWSMWKKKNQAKDPSLDHNVRFYWLKSAKDGRASTLPLIQRFLHVAQPTKWRQRLIDVAINARLYTGEERVASIHEDGEEAVYGLTTTTGNYVIWGLASSNSQYMQHPTPRGGGIFKRAWWQVWDSPDGKFPVFDYLLASVDSAFTEQERNDPTALSVWGIFRNKEDKNRVMLVHAWRKHLQFSGVRQEPWPGESKLMWVERTQKDWGLVEWIKYSCERFKVDNLLVEAKASGMSAAQELANRYGRLNFGIQLCPVKGSKEARALSVQPIFAQGLVFAPIRDWAEMVMDEMESFPKHKYDDLTDSATQAIKFMKDNGLLFDDDEAEARVRDSVTHISKKSELSFW